MRTLFHESRRAGGQMLSPGIGGVRKQEVRATGQGGLEPQFPSPSRAFCPRLQAAVEGEVTSGG